ncbi:MAG: TerB family tellurite resistance protein [Yoonia sp.]|nr:TerB family tellurite resistance protein [Yoonia sp.]
MFSRILALFHVDNDFSTPLPEADARNALGALMVRAAKADHAYLFEEVEKIDAVLSKLYGLNPVQAAKMRAGCEKLEEEMPATEDLAEILHNAISVEAREAAVAALWSVVFADGEERPEEDLLLHAIEKSLGVSPEVSKRLHDAEMAKLPPKRD